MSYRYIKVKTYKRGASWEDGTSRLCTRCGYENRKRRGRAVVTAFLKYAGSKYKTPVGYCEDHVPESLTGGR